VFDFKDPHDHATTKENYRQLTEKNETFIQEWIQQHPMRHHVELEDLSGVIYNNKTLPHGSIKSFFGRSLYDSTRCFKTYELNNTNRTESYELFSRNFDNEIFYQHKAYNKCNNHNIDVNGVNYTLRIPIIYGVNKKLDNAQFEMEYIPVEGVVPKNVVDRVNEFLIQKGIYHNDLHKKNIVFGGHNVIVVLDFGSADYKKSSSMGGKRSSECDRYCKNSVFNFEKLSKKVAKSHGYTYKKIVNP